MKLFFSLLIFVTTTLAYGQQYYSDQASPTFKEPVTSVATLPTLGNMPGDIRAETTAFGLYIWDGVSWNTLSPGGGGFVTSVGLSLTGPLFTISNSPVTGAGTLTGTINTQTANRVFAGPAVGVATAPTFRALVAADIPALSYQPVLSTSTAPANQFANGFTAPNTFTYAQPAFSNLSGTISAAQMLALPTADIYVGDGSNQPAAVAMSGDATLASSGAITIANNAVTNAKLAQMANNTVKGNTSGVLANASDLALGDLTDAGTDGITVTGGSKVVVGAGTSLSQQVSDATHNGYLASADWVRFNNITQVQSGKTFYVDGSRSDSYVEDGTENYPFKDPQTAVNQIITNADNDSTHPYTLLIKPALYSNLTLSNAALVYVNLIGLGGSGGSTITFSTIDFTGSNLFRGGFSGLGIAILNLTASAAGGTFFIDNCKVATANIQNAAEVDMNATPLTTFNLTNAPLVFYQNGYFGISGVTTLVNSNLIMQSSSFLANVSVDSTSGLFTRNGVRMSSGTLTLNGAMQAYGSWIGATVNIGATGSLLNRGSFIDPANISITAGGSYTQNTTAQMIGYTPTTAGNWNSVPTQVRGALDTLATSGVVKSQAQNLVLASPDGSSGVPTFRALVAADLPGGTGTVSTVSVVSANGFAGSVANATTTPAITLSTSISGVLKGNGTAISAAVANTDYQNPISTSTAPANQFATGFTSPNTFTYAQPSFSNISGTIAVAQLPLPVAQATKSANYTVVLTDGVLLGDASGGAFVFTLPAASTAFTGGRSYIFTFKKTDSSANTVSVTAAGADLIDGLATQVLSSQYNAFTITTDGSNWYVQ